MNPGLSDPNNHVPQLSPDDGWEDVPAKSDHPLPIPVLPRLPVPQLSETSPSSSKLKDPSAPVLRVADAARRGPSRPSPIRLQVEKFGDSAARSGSTATPPPKVERVVAFHEKPALLAEQPESRGESGEWGHENHGAMRWILGMGAAVVVLVVLVMALLPTINAPNAVRRDEPAPLMVTEEDKDPRHIAALNQILNRQPEALKIYRNFLAAAHSDEVVPLIRDISNVKDALRKNWRPYRIPSQWELAPDTGWAVMDLEGHPCGLLAGLLPDNSKFLAYFTSDNGRLLLDWKATTGYGTATFQDLEKGIGDGSEIRGNASIIEFYTPQFPEKTYQSFRLVSPDGESLIWCYADRNSASYPTMTRKLKAGPIIDKAEDSEKVTLSLKRGPEGSLPNQWQIQQLLQTDWVSR